MENDEAAKFDFASLAQLARARDLESRGRWFESDKRLKKKNLSLILRNGQIPEWPNGADCKSAGLRLRWFESIFAH